jgi:hypothetical protein
MTEQEQKIIEIYRKLENQKSKDDLLFQAETMVRAQEALKADYGLDDQKPSVRKPA